MTADDAEAAGVPYDEGEEAGGLPYDAHADEAWDDEYDEPEGEERRADPEATELLRVPPRSEPRPEPDLSYDDEDDDPFADEPVGEETQVRERPADDAPPPPEPAARTPEPVAAPDPEPDDLLMDDELFADPPARRSESAGDETVEYHVEDALAEEGHAEEGHAEGEDPLEETPEFLQDTPDHDRLWFEQRPPRDFDFDK